MSDAENPFQSPMSLVCPGRRAAQCVSALRERQENGQEGSNALRSSRLPKVLLCLYQSQATRILLGRSQLGRRGYPYWNIPRHNDGCRWLLRKRHRGCRIRFGLVSAPGLPLQGLLLGTVPGQSDLWSPRHRPDHGRTGRNRRLLQEKSALGDSLHAACGSIPVVQRAPHRGRVVPDESRLEEIRKPSDFRSHGDAEIRIGK